MKKRDNSKINVHPLSLGLCEHCGKLLTIQDMPYGSIDAEWYCPKCKKIINSKTFGWEKTPKGEWKKARWVGEDGKWTDKEPEEEFDLGCWHISKQLPIS